MKKRSDWQGEDWPECPNNSRHGQMQPDPNGGWFCDECKAAHTPRSRETYRWGGFRVYACKWDAPEKSKEEKK